VDIAEVYTGLAERYYHDSECCSTMLGQETNRTK